MNFSTLTTFPEGEKADWNALIPDGVHATPFLRFDYLKTWWQTRGGGEWGQDAQLVIVTASENGKNLAYAPCFVADHQGSKELLFLGSIEISDYLDFLVHPSHLDEFVNGFMTYVRQELAPKYGITAIDLYNIVDHSPTIQALQEASTAQGLAIEITPLQRCPYISLSGDWDEYLEHLDKKQRHEIRRKMRRALEMTPAAEWYISSNPATIDQDIEDFLRLMAFDEKKKAFLTPAMREQMTTTMRSAFKSGMLQLAFMTIGGEKAAAYLNFDYLNRIWVYNSGIDPRFFEASPGWVLLGHLLKWSCENGRFEFDFMRGDEEYKYRFGAVDRQVNRVRITL